MDLSSIEKLILIDLAGLIYYVDDIQEYFPDEVVDLQLLIQHVLIALGETGSPELAVLKLQSQYEEEQLLINLDQTAIAKIGELIYFFILSLIAMLESNGLDWRTPFERTYSWHVLGLRANRIVIFSKFKKGSFI